MIIWEDRRSGTSDVYAQYVNNSNGQMKWTNGTAVSAAYEKQSRPVAMKYLDEVIIAWEDYRNNPSMSDIYAQKIDIYGTAKWAPDGIAICTAFMYQVAPVLASDGTGGVTVAWHDYRAGNDVIDLYAQGVNSNGTLKSSANSFWQPTNGPYQAGTTTPEWITNIEVSTSGSIFAGGYRSDDGGNTWLDLGIVTTFGFAIDDLNHIVYAGTENSGKIYKSSDWGQTWQVSFSPTFGGAYFMEVSPEGYVFASLQGSATEGGIYRSMDQGLTWTHLTNGLGTVVGLSAGGIGIAPNGDLFFGAGNGELFRSSNNGDTWSRVDSFGQMGGLIYTIAFNSNDGIYVGGNGGIKFSPDNGVSWQDRSFNGGEISSILILPDNNAHIYAGSGGGQSVFHSNDSGNS